MRLALVTLCGLLLSFNGFGQSRKAVQQYERSLRYMAKHDWTNAEQRMRMAIKEDGSYTDAYTTLAKWLLARHDYKGCIDLMQDGEKRCANGHTVFNRPLVIALLGAGQTEAALQRIPTSGKDSIWKVLREQAAFQQQAWSRRDTTHVLPVGPPWRVNSSEAELFPFLSPDGQKLYYTRRVAGIDEDFYVARPDTCEGGWLTGRPLGDPFNTAQQEAAQSVSSDGHYLFFMRCDNRTRSGWDLGGCDLYMAYTADSVWSVPQSFGGTINTPGYEGMPCLSPDNRVLYFVSDRPGGSGGLDIWCSHFEHGLWQMPQNLGPSINTAGDETAPFICNDNATLFFASNGRPGMGGSDIFFSKKRDTTWSDAINIGAPFNTPYDEASPSLAADGKTFYFASDRDSVAGNFDLYQAILTTDKRPEPTVFVTGEVHDSLTTDRLNYANIFITDSATGRELYQVVSNRGDGSYGIALPAGHAYELVIDRIAYHQKSDILGCPDTLAGGRITRNFSMLPYDYQKPVHDSLVLTLHFPKNSTMITDSARLAIESMLSAWRGKAGISVFINGYTDNSGTPMLNEQLSYTRALEVSNIVKSTGFTDNDLKAQGWGEANPVATNDTDEDRDKNRRVEIIVRE